MMDFFRAMTKGSRTVSGCIRGWRYVLVLPFILLNSNAAESFECYDVDNIEIEWKLYGKKLYKYKTDYDGYFGRLCRGWNGEQARLQWLYGDFYPSYPDYGGLGTKLKKFVETTPQPLMYRRGCWEDEPKLTKAYPESIVGTYAFHKEDKNRWHLNLLCGRGFGLKLLNKALKLMHEMDRNVKILNLKAAKGAERFYNRITLSCVNEREYKTNFSAPITYKKKGNFLDIGNDCRTIVYECETLDEYKDWVRQVEEEITSQGLGTLDKLIEEATGEEASCDEDAIYTDITLTGILSDLEQTRQ